MTFTGPLCTVDETFLVAVQLSKLLKDEHSFTDTTTRHRKGTTLDFIAYKLPQRLSAPIDQNRRGDLRNLQFNLRDSAPRILLVAFFFREIELVLLLFLLV